MSTIWMHAEKRRQHRTNQWWFGLEIGFFAGLIWGLLKWMFYSFKFTLVEPGFWADLFLQHAFLRTGWGLLVGFGFFIIQSIVAAYLYLLLLKRFKGPMPGLIYGAAWWGMMILGVGPLFRIIKPLQLIGWNTLITELCIYLLWGLFIGYSVAFEFHDEASREPLLSRLRTSEER